MPSRRKGPNPRKIFWSPVEKQQVARRAVDIRAVNPTLSTLDLFRQAQEILPEKRRRSVPSKSRIDWFEEAFEEEMVRRDLEERARDDATRLIKEQTGKQYEWMKAQLDRYDRMLPTLEESARQAHRTADEFAEFRRLATGWKRDEDQWREGVMKFNGEALKLLEQTARLTKEHADKATEYERKRREDTESIREDHRAIIGLLREQNTSTLAIEEARRKDAEGLRTDNRKMIDLLGQFCAALHDMKSTLCTELHDLNVNLRVMAGAPPGANGHQAPANGAPGGQRVNRRP
jgi:hypothetical protein